MLSLPQVDTVSGEPIYRQLYRHIRGTIESGVLLRGEKLPPTRELAGLLGVNRTTVSAAYELLESEGFIRGHVGRGSYVEGPALLSRERLDWERILRLYDGADTPAATAPHVRTGDQLCHFAALRPTVSD